MWGGLHSLFRGRRRHPRHKCEVRARVMKDEEPAHTYLRHATLHSALALARTD